MNEKEELKYFTETALSYLIDNGYVVSVMKLTGYYMLTLKGDGEWDAIKEEYLFFIDILLNDYQLVGRRPFKVKESYSSYDLTLDEFREMENDPYSSVKISVFVAPKK